MTNSADPDQLASEKPTDLDLHCLQRQGIYRFSRARVKKKYFLPLGLEKYVKYKTRRLQRGATNL